MKTIITALILSLFLSTSSFGFPLSEDGNSVSVTLLDVSNLDKETLSSEFHGSPDGLRFIFAIQKRTKTDGNLGLKELKDFSVNGHQYSSLSEDHTEPMTTLNDPSQVTDTYGDIDFSKFDDEHSKIMITKIAGSRLPENGEFEVKVTFAWGGIPETFEFKFNQLN